MRWKTRWTGFRWEKGLSEVMMASYSLNGRLKGC